MKLFRRKVTTGSQSAFTLIEILFVVTIIGILLAIIVPRMIKTRVESKYGNLDQVCTELSGYTAKWAETSIRSQDETLSTATTSEYYATLAGVNVAAGEGQQWVAAAGSNWNNGNPPIASRPGLIAVTGRIETAGGDTLPEGTVEGLVPPDKALLNPFNNVNVFRTPNLPGATPVVGAIGFGFQSVTDAAGVVWNYFALAYQGTESTTVDLTLGTTFHGAQELGTPQGILNAILVERSN